MTTHRDSNDWQDDPWVDNPAPAEAEVAALERQGREFFVSLLTDARLEPRWCLWCHSRNNAGTCTRCGITRCGGHSQWCLCPEALGKVIADQTGMRDILRALRRTGTDGPDTLLRVATDKLGFYHGIIGSWVDEPPPTPPPPPPTPPSAVPATLYYVWLTYDEAWLGFDDDDAPRSATWLGAAPFTTYDEAAAAVPPDADFRVVQVELTTRAVLGP